MRMHDAVANLLSRSRRLSMKSISSSLHRVMSCEESNLSWQVTEWFFGRDEQEDAQGLSKEEEARREEIAQSLRREWAARIARYLAFCVDGVSLGRRFGLRHLVQAAIGGPAGPPRLRPADRAKIERMLEFLVHFRDGDKPFEPGAEPCRFNIFDAFLAPGKRRDRDIVDKCQLNDGVRVGGVIPFHYSTLFPLHFLISPGLVPVECDVYVYDRPDLRLPCQVLARLIRLQYVKAVMKRYSDQAYPALLTALLCRKSNARSLTLQISNELSSLACVDPPLSFLTTRTCIDTLVRHIRLRANDEMVLCQLSLALDGLARHSETCRTLLSNSGLPRVVVPQLLRANLAVRTVFLRLLEHCYKERRSA
mmetsp:Transcript_73947/g.197088  ORF Transcript_73947/g.197088 Transcript_73947/m.197088 type:complete len:365 (-) Transcript_73947:456-1550(-)